MFFGTSKEAVEAKLLEFQHAKAHNQPLAAAGRL
jgi:hypothetical protein